MGFSVEKDWKTAAGFRAVVIVVDRGHRCGYVGVPAGHPLHGVEYNQPSSWLKAVTDEEEIGKRGVLSVLSASVNSEDGRMQSPEMVFNVHGSLTYSGGNGAYPVASDLWWFGYDCAHCDDEPDLALMSEKYRELELRYGTSGGVVRSLDYCVNECESLARQINEKVSP